MTNKIQRLAKVSAVALSTFGLVANTAFAQTLPAGTNGDTLRHNGITWITSTEVKNYGIDGVVATGTYGSGSGLSISGAGTRMMWYPKKSAFRAGTVIGTEWDDANIGNGSVAFGMANSVSGGAGFAVGQQQIVSGNSSFAGGSDNVASGHVSFVFGSDSHATGGHSVAFGSEVMNSGSHSALFGQDSTNSGAYSFGTGYGINTSSSYSFATGRYNIGGGHPTNWVATDPLFEIGNGTGPTAKSNALTVLKNGNIGIGTHTPTEKLAVNGNVSVTGNITTNAQLKANSANITNNLEVNGSANFRSGQISLRPYTNHLLKPTQPACDGNNVGTIIFFEDQFKGCTSKGWKNLDM